MFESHVPDVLSGADFFELSEHLLLFYRFAFKFHLENSIPVQFFCDEHVSMVVLFYAAEGQVG